MSLTSNLVLPAVSTIPASSTSSEVAAELGKLLRRVMTIEAIKAAQAESSSQAKLSDITPIGAAPVPLKWETLSKAARTAATGGHTAEAEKMLLTAHELAFAFDQSDRRIADSLDNLATFYLAQKRYAEAEHYGKLACEAAVKAGPRHEMLLATCLNSLAGALYELGRFEQSEQICVRVLTIYNKALGPEHVHCGVAANNLAMVYQVQGKFELAELMYERALPIRVKELGHGHPSVVALLNNYMNLMAQAKKAPEAQSDSSAPKAKQARSLMRMDTTLRMTA